MYLKMDTQPEPSCRLANSRTRPDNSACYLAGESASDSGSRCVRVAARLHDNEPAPTGPVRLYGSIVSTGGNNHPYKLQGPGCQDGVFVHQLHFSATKRVVFVELNQVMVVTCSQNKWAHSMDEKRQKYNFLPAAGQKLNASTVKSFLIQFRLEGQRDSEAIVTRVIEASSQPTAASATAASGANLAALQVLDILPAQLYLMRNGSNSLEIHIALLLNDAAPDNSSGDTRCHVTGYAVCKMSHQRLDFTCSEPKHIKHLLMTKAVISAELLSSQSPSTTAWDCWLRVAIETNGTYGQSVEYGPVPLFASCAACQPVDQTVTPSYLPCPDGSLVRYYYPDPSTEELPQLRRKLPGAAAAAAAAGAAASAAPANVVNHQQQLQLLSLDSPSFWPQPALLGFLPEEAAAPAECAAGAAAAAPAAAADRRERQNRREFKVDFFPLSPDADRDLDDISAIIDADL